MSELFRTAEIVGKDKYGDNVYESGARRHSRPVVAVVPTLEITYCPEHDVTYPVFHDICGLITLRAFNE